MAYILQNDSFNGDLRTKKGTALEQNLQFEWLTIKKEGTKIFGLAYCQKEPTKCFTDDKTNKKAEYPGIVGFVVDSSSEFIQDKVSFKTLEGLEEGKFYCGYVQLGFPENVAKKCNDNPKKFELYAEDFCSFTEVEKPDTVPSELKWPSGKGGFQKKSFTKTEIATQRMDALEAVLTNEKLSQLMDGMAGLMGDDLSEEMMLQLVLALIA